VKQTLSKAKRKTCGTVLRTVIRNFVMNITGSSHSAKQVTVPSTSNVPSPAQTAEVPAHPNGAIPTGASDMADEGEKSPPAPPRSLTIAESSMDGRAVMYVQTVFWVASYVRQRAKKGDVTQEQLIEQFGVNVRSAIDPEWRPQG